MCRTVAAETSSFDLIHGDRQQLPARLDWVDLGAGRFALTASTTVALAAEVGLEHKTREQGSSVRVALAPALRLTDGCAKSNASPDCRTLAAGEVIIPPAWNGSSCADSCCSERAVTTAFAAGRAAPVRAALRYDASSSGKLSAGIPHSVQGVQNTGWPRQLEPAFDLLAEHGAHALGRRARRANM